ncbi:peptide MFS transporter [Coxiella-like endosymbiont]|uniref:peptide MFS transporter n=1 Tax=Coxiella-like endosymbiont TaxID=1592897 RepID=UPI00272CD0FC|nr:oligopeptide:H+ symporter [Coxiella-like endosymbiont]
MTEKHPKGLYLLFFTELWERFGFYTVTTILILYLVQSLHFTDQHADLLYGAFSALLYLTPPLGGFIADRYIGFQKTILWGSCLFILGYLLTALPSQQGFFIGLALLVVANGLFKPNVSSILGTLYGRDDPRRDGGFTLFYMGINVGSLIPPIFIGAVVHYYGWHVGFLFAALGMVIGMITFFIGHKRLGNRGALPTQSPLNSFSTKIKFNTVLCLGIIASVALIQLCFDFPALTNTIVVIGTFLIFLAVVYLLLKEKRAQRNKMTASLILIAISIGFWALYNQTFSSLMLFADRNMDTHLFGFKINAEFTQFFNPFFIIALSPLLSRLWISLDKKKINPSIPTKFALGVLFVALGFLLLAFGTQFFGTNGLTSPWWLISSYFLQTIGELFLSPVGLAMITVLSPPRLVGLMMGIWFLSQSAAFAIAGSLATLASVPAQLSPICSLSIYSHAFLVYGTITSILTMVSFVLIPLLKRLIRTSEESITQGSSRH